MSTVGWGRWHAPKKVLRNGIFVELMAGSRSLATMMAACGVWATSFEISENFQEDVMHPHNRKWLEELVQRHLCAGVWIGLVCASWSLARRNTTGKPGFPAPLRDSHGHLWGLPGLSERDQERVRNGNRQVRWACRLFAWLAARGIPCIIENPLTSRVWLTAPMQRLLASFPSVVISYCAFGTSWKKPTRLLFCHVALEKLAVCKCSVVNSVCSFSKKPHQVLSGYSKEHKRMWSAVASEYPKLLCAQVAQAVLAGATR